MTPIRLLKLTQLDICIGGFFTDLDQEISAEILKINEDNHEVIIQCEKALESQRVHASIYAFNRVYVLTFEVTCELGAGNQYCLKIPDHMNSSESEDICNTYGALTIKSPIPSLCLSIDNHPEKEATIQYKCHVLSSEYLIVEVNGESLYGNLIDCINQTKEMTFSGTENNHKTVLPVGAIRLNQRFVKIIIQHSLNVEHLNIISPEKIMIELDKLVEKNIQTIHEICEKDNL
ncbi:hypothetical protein [Photobacterium galatheae]|uniref:Uncharacterized protein n=1 Tax=Photobacterium galatheae TaxID=1654360 RepID=A0A066RTW9_9GAMM|nr:hypothetical protein [Photobacterium galatheae]KDM90823.1 hypothetical protein EA58_13765 [Photobacterium galatheae]MCM0149209.1 hypothetical protein [Photobacterium galatheae]